nr:MAG TPA: hypothetical protein [Caudoviricetes sp.]
MDVRTMYERVTRYAKIPIPAFLDYYNDAAAGLLSTYGARHVLTGGVVQEDANSLDSATCIRREYDTAMMDKIIYLATGNTDRLTLYERDADAAYRTVFRILSRGKISNIRATNDPFSAKCMREGEDDV